MAALSRFLVQLILIRLLASAPPAIQPVLINQHLALFSLIFFESKSAYVLGCLGMNGAPKQVENVAWGSVTPISVPATLAV